MKGDFSRSTFDHRKHYKGVRMQQGRVQLDADWNENLDILLHRIETETRDVIGLCGFPIHGAGFGVVADPSLLSSEEQQRLTEKGILPLKAGDFLLSAGRGYVDGILCEIDETIPFSKQPNVLPPASDPIFSSDGTFLLYLDVWERLITVLEDPAIREVALGGPDTTVRSQVIWQIKSLLAGDANANLDCESDVKDWPPQASDGTLCARTQPEKEPDDPCSIAPGAGYKRLENQLYRVEIHKGSGDANGPTFKWSRDNGSIVVKVDEFNVDGSAVKLRVSSLGRDDVLGLHELDWVEVLDDATELSGIAGQLVQIDKIDRERMIITLKSNVGSFDINLHPKLRRWDSKGELTVAVPATNDGYIALEDGIEVHFDTNKTYRTGDYWTIPARTVPGQYGDIEWPKEGNKPACLTAFGIQHHYCKLAIVVVDDGEITEVTDCRDKFPPLTELPTGGASCCSVTVGEGGDYADIQQAIDARPPDAKFWNICLLSGEHKLQKTVVVDGQDGISFSGCSDQTLISGAAGQPLFKVSNSIRVRIDGLMLQASAPMGAILAIGCMDFWLKNCRGMNVADTSTGLAGKGAAGPMLVAVQCDELTVQGNVFHALPAVIVQGNSILISDNSFTGGGVQVLFGSQVVSIEDNLILKGEGTGIQLSGDSNLDKEGNFEKVEANFTEYKALEAIRETKLVTIKHNLIGAMKGSGIATMLDLTNPEILGEVSYLVIDHNEIISCADAADVTVSSTTKAGGGMVLSSVSDVSIQGNLVAQNGEKRSPACGILIINGANVEISDNQVMDNGTDEEESNNGYQTGIGAVFVIGNALTLTDILGQNLSDLKPGVPALRVHGNQVSAPAGLALNVLAYGTVQVNDNSFVTRGRREQPALLPGVNEMAAGVQIANLGYQSWLAGLTGGQAAAIYLETGQGAALTTAEKSVPDGRVMFNDNQVTLVFPAVEGRDPRFVTAGVLIVSQDDIGLDGNQIQSDVTPDMLLADGFVIGNIVRATGNSFSEPGGSAFYSYASQGKLMNSTVANQAVHCIITAAPQNIDMNNQVLLAQLCQRFSNIQGGVYLAHQ